MDPDAIGKLSEMQIACLRLVAELKKTEQIAGELGISPSTVNTHIERAMARLQVTTRREAARLVVAHDASRQPVGESQTFSLGDATTDGVVSRPEKQPTEEKPLSLPPAPLPIGWSLTTTTGRRRNDLTITQRFGLAVLALVLFCIGVAGLGAAIEQLSSWRASLATHR